MMKMFPCITKRDHACHANRQVSRRLRGTLVVTVRFDISVRDGQQREPYADLAYSQDRHVASVIQLPVLVLDGLCLALHSVSN